MELAGIVWRAPMTVGTNAMLAATCFCCSARLSGATNLRTRMWGWFFLSLGVAAMTGVAKHGLSAYAGSAWFNWVLLVCNLSAGASTYYAQRVTLESGLFGAKGRRRLLALVRLQMLAFALQVLYTPTFGVVMMQTGLGLSGVLIAEWAAFNRGFVKRGWTVTGLAITMVPGVICLFRWPSWPFFDHVDLAHVVLLASSVLLYLGARAGEPAEVL